MASDPKPRPYTKPVLREYGRMDAVTRKTFVGKGGGKKDPGTIFWNRD